MALPLRTLVYRERMSLEEFGIDGENSLNSLLYDKLLDIPEIQRDEIDSNKAILTLFNDVYYVCTAVLLTEHPERDLDNYRNILGELIHDSYAGIHKLKHVRSYCGLAMVYCLLFSLHDDCQKTDRLMRKIVSSLSGEISKSIFRNFCECCSCLRGVLEVETFAPRNLNPKILLDIDWLRETSNFAPDKIRNIVYQYGKTTQECLDIIYAIDGALRQKEDDFLPFLIYNDEAHNCISSLIVEIKQYGCPSKTHKEGRNIKKDILPISRIATVTNQKGYSTKDGRNNNVHDFRRCVTFPEDSESVMQRLHELIDSQILPKDILMPLRAAVDAGVIRQPTWGEFCAEFGCDKVKSKTSLSTYLAKSYKFTDEAFNLLVKEFVEYRNRS